MYVQWIGNILYLINLYQLSLTSLIKGHSTTTYVDRILSFFAPPPLCVDSFHTLSVDKNRHFLTPSSSSLSSYWMPPKSILIALPLSMLNQSLHLFLTPDYLFLSLEYENVNLQLRQWNSWHKKCIFFVQIGASSNIANMKNSFVRVSNQGKFWLIMKCFKKIERRNWGPKSDSFHLTKFIFSSHANFWSLIELGTCQNVKRLTILKPI